ncbi:helix-turn-helix domain-containing protein [Bacteroides faecium]|uniref:Helix-turn-helix domain-containing protein n=1 Tax=Bacteroides faecium TaxID=2715212 RepID=A0A6H0KPP2_9BACE|nr:helix-turn-helix domain-containing protein [Bacteroides faecium]QIU95255.1 helix-turn-helix domain-containing protein [Bacteroides faecium]
MLRNFVILFPAFVSLFWALLFMMRWKRNSRSQNIWAVALLLLSNSMSIAALYWHDYEDYSLIYKLDVLETISTLSFIPVVFLYFERLTGVKKKGQIFRKILLFIPPVLMGGSTVLFYLIVGEERAAEFFKYIVEHDGALSPGFYEYRYVYMCINVYTYSAFLVVQAVLVFIYAGRNILMYRKQLDDFFSNLEGKSMDHHRATLKGLMLFLILVIAIAGSGNLLYVDFGFMVLVFLFLLGGVIFYLCYHVYFISYSADNFIMELKLSDEEALENGYGIMGEDDFGNADTGNMLRAKLLPQLTQVIEEDKVYLQNDLRLDDLARLLHTNRTYISRFIKEEFQCNFSEFINRKRIEYAQELFRESPEMTQEQIAEMSGFTHASSFSRVFKQCAGMTFREFQKGH